MNKSAKMVIAFAAGAAAGLVAGLLLAPEKGADTRKKIVDAGKKVSNSISEMVGACKKEMAANSEG